MSEFRINRKSWHYKIARYFSHSWHKEPETFCQYWRDFILSALFLGVIGTLVGVFFVAVVVTIITNPVPVAISIIVASFIIAFLVFIFFSASKINKAHENAMETENPSLLQMKYRVIKEKICPPIEYM